MNTRTKKIRISNLMIDTVKKDIKNIHLGVYPPNGRVRVSAPLKTNDEAIRFFVLSKIPWIRKQQLKFLRQERQTKRDYVSGESHYFLGRRYRLNIVHTDEKPKIEFNRKSHIDFYVNPDTNVSQREKIFEKFYRNEIRKLVPMLLDKWQNKLGVSVNEVRIKKMKTKWGTCNSDKRRIWLNLELAKKPLNCIDYVFVHELVHLLEHNHSEKFVNRLESVLPTWQSDKEELNRNILGYSEWDAKTDCDLLNELISKNNTSKAKKATKTVLRQAEVIAKDWVK